jgi:hypothetical protein
MPLFIRDQIEALNQGDLRGFTEADRYHHDDQGNGILHYLMRSLSPNIVVIRDAVTRLRVSPHTFNQSWKSPIDLALEGRHTDIAELLLQQAIQVDLEYLNLVLGSAFDRYYRAATTMADRQAIVGFYASQLCGQNVHDTFEKRIGKVKARKKYFYHLNWVGGFHIDGLPWDFNRLPIAEQRRLLDTTKQALTGFYPQDFLPLRIRSVLQIFLRIYGATIGDDDLKIIDPSTVTAAPLSEMEFKGLMWERRCALSSALREEIQRDLQTYFVLLDFGQINASKSF